MDPYNRTVILTCKGVVYCPECKERMLVEMPADCQLVVVVDCTTNADFSRKHRLAFERDPEAHLMEPGDPIPAL